MNKIKTDKEFFSYIIVGILTTSLNILVYLLCLMLLNLHYFYANILAWVVGVVFAFFLNKNLVFKVDGEILKMFISFLVMRIISVLVETVVLAVGIDFLLLNNFFVKLCALCFTTILNYIFSKRLVFKGISKN